MQFNYLMCLVKIILDSAGIDTLNRPLGAFLNPSGSSLAPSLGIYLHYHSGNTCSHSRFLTTGMQLSSGREEEHAVSP